MGQALMVLEKIRLILLPGLDGTGDLYEPLLGHIGPTLKTEVVSYPADQRLSYRELADHVAGFLPWDSRYVLVAESFSGAVAAHLATRKPPGLAGIVFIASFITPPKPCLLAMARFVPFGLLPHMPFSAFIVRRLCLSSKSPDDLIEMVRQAVYKIKSEVLRHRIAMIRKLRMENWRETYEIPCCCIQAAGDKLVSPSCFGAIQAIFPRVQRIVIDGPHLIAQSEPEKCSKAIIDFIQSI
jgi:pimeloyl-[acyl-carrier protein] methyl ester esterase